MGLGDLIILVWATSLLVENTETTHRGTSHVNIDLVDKKISKVGHKGDSVKPIWQS